MTHPANLPGSSLLGQFVQELTALGLTKRQVQAHLLFLRLWQQHVRPALLVDATPDQLETFLVRLRRTQAPHSEIHYAEDAIEHFYAFLFDQQPNFPAQASWAERMLAPPRPRHSLLWERFAERLTPVLRRLAPEWVIWPELRASGHDA
jgi:hypothetical protein